MPPIARLFAPLALVALPAFSHAQEERARSHTSTCGGEVIGNATIAGDGMVDTTLTEGYACSGPATTQEDPTLFVEIVEDGDTVTVTVVGMDRTWGTWRPWFPRTTMLRGR